MRSVQVLVAGAGPCGLGAALELLESGSSGPDDFLIVDPLEQAGGWASSTTTEEGFTFDFGGHVLFPHKKYASFGELLAGLPIAWASSLPARGVLVDGHFLPYPAQRNLQRLPLPALVRAIVSSLVHRRGATRENTGDLRSYLLNRFGPYVTGLLMEPLNRKQWAQATDALSDVWVAARSGSKSPNVADMDVGKTLLNLLLGRDDPGWTADTRVTYPAQGGSGAIWSAIASRIPAEKLRLNTRITALSLAEKTAVLSSGETIRWQHLVSTMPLDALLRMVELERPELAGKAQQLVRARSHLFGFGIRGKLPARYAGLHSCQVTDPSIPFWRLNFPMTVSHGNGPEGCFSLLCEVSESTAQPARHGLRGEVKASLYRMELLGRSGLKLLSTTETSLEHGYPVPFLGRDALLGEVQPVLEQAGIYSRGRFGSWRYEISNQDYAFMQGTEVVRRILFGIAEETFGASPSVPEYAAPTRSAASVALTPSMEQVQEA